MRAMLEKTDADRRSAVKSMLRIRAVESPPDASGQRTIWHRGARGAELVTQVDADGLVLRQDLTLFDEQLSWVRDQGFRAAQISTGGGSAANPAAATLSAVAEVAPVLARVVAALRGFKGDDKLIGHFRDAALQAAKGQAMFADPREVTRDAISVREALGEVPPKPAPRRRGLALAIAGLVLVIVAIALLLAQ